MTHTKFNRTNILHCDSIGCGQAGWGAALLERTFVPWSTAG